MKLIFLVFFTIAFFSWMVAVIYNIKMRYALKQRIKMEFGDKSQLSFVIENNYNIFKVWKIWICIKSSDSEQIKVEKGKIIKAIKIQIFSAILFIGAIILGIMSTSVG